TAVSPGDAMRAALAACGCALILAAAARAHGSSDAWLDLEVHGSRIDGRWDIALRDLDLAVDLDLDDDGTITWGGLRSSAPAISAYALSRLHLSADGVRCDGRVEHLEVDRRGETAYAVLRLRHDCPRPPAILELSYSLLQDLDPRHRGLLRLRDGGD